MIFFWRKMKCHLTKLLIAFPRFVAVIHSAFCVPLIFAQLIIILAQIIFTFGVIIFTPNCIIFTLDLRIFTETLTTFTLTLYILILTLMMFIYIFILPNPIDKARLARLIKRFAKAQAVGKLITSMFVNDI